MPSFLKDFYLNEGMRQDVKTYLTQFLTDKAVAKVFNREETSGVAEAMEIIEEAFENLETLFPSKSEGKEIINESR